MPSEMHVPREEGNSFGEYFEYWITEQNKDLDDLVLAAKEHEHSYGRIDNAMEEEGKAERLLVPLIDRVVKHYEHYYQEKSTWAKKDVLKMLHPSWRSNLEDAFLWIGGWRPSMAFHLLYSKCGLQLEARLSELIRGLRTGDLGDLSSVQLAQVDELQRKTIEEEKAISEKQANQQEKVADASMVELSHVVTEMMRATQAGSYQEGVALEEERVESTLAPKEEGLVEILQMADDLRLKTLKEIIKILSPTQAVQFLIAAAELHLRIHDWGKMRDAKHHVTNR